MILVTGFEPFGGELVNPSEMALAELAMDHSLKTQVLPVDFNKAFEVLRSAMEPDIEFILMLGQAGGSYKIRLESQAQDGDQVLINHLPVRKILDQAKSQLVESGLSSWLELSSFAGTYVCNNLYFKVMSQLKSVPSLFVHMPYIPMQVINKSPGIGSLGLQDQMTIIRSVIGQI